MQACTCMFSNNYFCFSGFLNFVTFGSVSRVPGGTVVF